MRIQILADILLSVAWYRPFLEGGSSDPVPSELFTIGSNGGNGSPKKKGTKKQNHVATSAATAPTAVAQTSQVDGAADVNNLVDMMAKLMNRVDPEKRGEAMEQLKARLVGDAEQPPLPLNFAPPASTTAAPFSSPLMSSKEQRAPVSTSKNLGNSFSNKERQSPSLFMRNNLNSSPVRIRSVDVSNEGSGATGPVTPGREVGDGFHFATPSTAVRPSGESAIGSFSIGVSSPSGGGTGNAKGPVSPSIDAMASLGSPQSSRAASLMRQSASSAAASSSAAAFAKLSSPLARGSTVAPENPGLFATTAEIKNSTINTNASPGRKSQPLAAKGPATSPDLSSLRDLIKPFDDIKVGSAGGNVHESTQAPFETVSGFAIGQTVTNSKTTTSSPQSLKAKAKRRDKRPDGKRTAKTTTTVGLGSVTQVAEPVVRPENMEVFQFGPTSVGVYDENATDLDNREAVASQNSTEGGFSLQTGNEKDAPSPFGNDCELLPPPRPPVSIYARGEDNMDMSPVGPPADSSTEVQAEIEGNINASMPPPPPHADDKISAVNNSTANHPNAVSTDDSPGTTIINDTSGSAGFSIGIENRSATVKKSPSSARKIEKKNRARQRHRNANNESLQSNSSSQSELPRSDLPPPPPPVTSASSISGEGSKRADAAFKSSDEEADHEADSGESQGNATFDAAAAVIGKADGLVARARHLYAQANYSTAVECYTSALEAVRSIPRTTKPKQNFSLFGKKKDNSKPSSNLESDWDGYLKALGNRSACYMMLGIIHPAMEDCKAVLKEQPDNLKIRIRLGAGLLKVGSLTQSNEAYKYVVEKATALRDSSTNTTEKEAALKCEQDAKEGIEQVFKLKYAMERAYSAQRRSQHDEAVRQAGLAIAIAPHDHKMYSVRATALYKFKKWKQCVDECVECARMVAVASPRILERLVATIDKHSNVDSNARQVLRADATSNPIGVITCGRLMTSKMCQLFVPALRYCERCAEAEAILRILGEESTEARVWVLGEVKRIEDLRQGKESGDAAFRRGKYHAAVALYSEALGIDANADRSVFILVLVYCGASVTYLNILFLLFEFGLQCECCPLL